MTLITLIAGSRGNLVFEFLYLSSLEVEKILAKRLKITTFF